MTNEEAIKILEEMKARMVPLGPLLEGKSKDEEAVDIAIEALSKQCASSEQAGKDIKFPTIHCCRGYDCIKDENGRTGFGVYDPQEKNIYIAGDVPKEIFLKALFHEIFHWIQDVAGMKFNEDDANSFSDILYDAVDMFDNHGPELFGQKTIVEPGEQFIGEDLLKEALDQNADSGKTIVLKKRTIIERLTIAKSLIDGVIADSDNDQFRDTTKKTEDVPDNQALDGLSKLSSAQPEIKTDGDTISRQMAIDAVKKNTFRLTFAEEQNCEGHVAWSANAVYSDVMEGALLNLPSAQPEPKAGHWIHKHERTTNTWECSNCGYRVNLMDGGIYKFCSACGEKKEDGEYG